MSTKWNILVARCWSSLIISFQFEMVSQIFITMIYLVQAYEAGGKYWHDKAKIIVYWRKVFKYLAKLLAGLLTSEGIVNDDFLWKRDHFLSP